MTVSFMFLFVLYKTIYKALVISSMPQGEQLGMLTRTATNVLMCFVCL